MILPLPPKWMCHTCRGDPTVHEKTCATAAYVWIIPTPWGRGIYTIVLRPQTEKVTLAFPGVRIDCGEDFSDITHGSVVRKLEHADDLHREFWISKTQRLYHHPILDYMELLMRERFLYAHERYRNACRNHTEVRRKLDESLRSIARAEARSLEYREADARFTNFQDTTTPKDPNAPSIQRDSNGEG